MLTSGLPEKVADEEDLARFLTQSNQYSSNGAKQNAFLPGPKTQDVSVSRHGETPRDRLRELGFAATRDRALRGAAIIQTSVVRESGLAVRADEPPDRHALIHGWPEFRDDPYMRKAKHKQIALELASKARLIAPL